MAIELRVLTGPRAGQWVRFDKPVITIGRHPDSDLQLDPEHDLDASSNHAEVHTSSGRHTLVDVGSTNGTFVNGRRITCEHELRDSDTITLGDAGPQIAVRLARAVAATRHSTAQRVAVAVNAHRRRTWRVLAIAAVILAVGVVAAYRIGNRDADARVRELTLLLAQTDSAASALGRRATERGDTSFANALQRRSDSLREDIVRRAAAASEREMDSLRAEVTRMRVAQQGLALLDFSSISESNDGAVAFVAAEIDGVPYGATAFGVGTGGLLVTNRHAVQSDAGSAATRIAVKYANTAAYLPAHVVRVSADDDLALLQVDIAGRYPVVSGISSATGAPRVGQPVAIIGFPHSLETPMEGEVAKTSLEGGTVSKRLDDVLQVSSYAGSGSSGSPVFDSRGDVVGVVWGGAAESQGRIVYAVPGARLAAFLPGGVKGSVR